MKLADKILTAIRRHAPKDPSEIMMPNFYLFGYEMDMMRLMTNGYVVEYEVKISRSDFFQDFKKMQEVYVYPIDEARQVQQFFKHDGLREGKAANRFFFVTPEGLVDKEEIPKHAGLIYYRDGYLDTKKPAPLLHKRVYSDYRRLAIAMSWRDSNLRHRLNRIKELNKLEL